MAARKPTMTPAPARPELDRLVEAARRKGVTDAQLQEQRLSFAYGNAPEDSKATRESIKASASTVRLKPA